MSERVTVYENLRGIVYLPLYLAMARGAWVAEGLDVDVKLSPSTDETALGLLAGRVDAAWGGPMRVLLHHDADSDCPLVCFGQVVARDPFILVGARPNPGFRFADLLGPRIAVASEVPTPWMMLRDDVARAGIDPAALNRAPDRPMAENIDALLAGEIDVAQVFEPHAARAIVGGAHLWHRFAGRGDLGFTTFYTTRGFATRRRAACQALVRGIAGILAGLGEEAPAALAGEVAEYFPDTEADLLSAAIGGYQASGVWARDPAYPPDAFVRLKAALLSGGLIARDIAYDRAVDAALCEIG